MRRQRARGDEPHLAAPPDAALTARAREEGFSVHPVAMRGTWDLGAALHLAGVMRGIRPEIVHWHAARAHALGAIAALIEPVAARVLSRRVQIPVRRSPGSRLLYALPIDRIAAISDAVRAALIGSGVDAAKIDVVPSGIDPVPPVTPARRAEIRAALGCGEEDVVGISVAALAPGKAQEDLLRAAALAAPRAPRLKLWLVGEGPLEEKLRTEQRSLGLAGAVTFLGFRNDVDALLRAADFFCIPTLSEGLGSSILEAMAAGLPVVATRVGGIPEIVEEGKTGLLVPPSDPAALADSLVLLTTGAELRARMGVAGEGRSRLFSADRTADLMYEVYRLALQARRGLTE